MSYEGRVCMETLTAHIAQYRETGDELSKMGGFGHDTDDTLGRLFDNVNITAARVHEKIW